MKTIFHPLRIAFVETLTSEALILKFSLPEHLEEIFSYTAGQHVTLRARICGKEYRRSYSICSAPQENSLNVAIKRLTGGIFSEWIHAVAKPGVTIDVLPPVGSFGIQFNADQARHVLAFACGSGITPILSILKAALLAEPRSRCTLVFGNRAICSVMFREELQFLKDQFMGRLNIIHLFTQEEQEINLFNGRVTRDKCEQLFDRWLPLDDVDWVCVCGPEPMMVEVVESLIARGISNDRIATELFTSRLKEAEPTVARQSLSGGGGKCTVTLILDGIVRRFVMASNAESVLDGALSAGIELPYSCKEGVCATCRCRIDEGRVEVAEKFALSNSEVNQGYVLSCKCFPVTETITADFDQRS